MQLEASSLILVVSGEMQIEVDYLPYTLKRSTVMQLLADNIIGNVSHTPGFRGYLLLFSPETEAGNHVINFQHTFAGSRKLETSIS
jgi:hypothetical protein